MNARKNRKYIFTPRTQNEQRLGSAQGYTKYNKQTNIQNTNIITDKE